MGITVGIGLSIMLAGLMSFGVHLGAKSPDDPPWAGANLGWADQVRGMATSINRISAHEDGAMIPTVEWTEKEKKELAELVRVVGDVVDAPVVISDPLDPRWKSDGEQELAQLFSEQCRASAIVDVEYGRYWS